MLTSLLGNDYKKGTFKTPLFYVFKSFSTNCLGNSVDTYVECDTFNTEKFKGIPYLDVTTVYSPETNTVFINVVNRHKDKAISSDILSSSGVFTGKAEVQVINAESLTDNFVYDKQDQYLPVTKQISTEKSKINFAFPPHSFTQIKVNVSQNK